MGDGQQDALLALGEARQIQAEWEAEPDTGFETLAKIALLMRH